MILCSLLSTALLLTICYTSAVLMENAQTTHIFHKLRHRHKRKENTKSSSISRNFPSHFDARQETQFVLNCPHVRDAHLEQVKIQVTWTKDETIWLKIRNGERLLSNKPTAFDRKNIGNKSILRIALNSGRYIFLYDEIKGNFSMFVSPIYYAEDAGLWQCHVTIQKDGKTQSMTSRSRIKDHHRTISDVSEDAAPDRRRKYTELNQNDPIKSKASAIRAFTRNEQSAVEIARNAVERDDIITFTRHSSGPMKHSTNTGRKMVVIENDCEADRKVYSNAAQITAFDDIASAQQFKHLIIVCLLINILHLLLLH